MPHVPIKYPSPFQQPQPILVKPSKRGRPNENGPKQTKAQSSQNSQMEHENQPPDAKRRKPTGDVENGDPEYLDAPKKIYPPFAEDEWRVVCLAMGTANDKLSTPTIELALSIISAWHARIERNAWPMVVEMSDLLLHAMLTYRKWMAGLDWLACRAATAALESAFIR